MSESPAPLWSAPKRVAFRFVFVYLILYNCPFPFNLFDLTEPGFAQRWWDAAWGVIIGWVGRVFLHQAALAPPNSGSSDSLANNLQVLCYALIALIVTIVWSILDRKRPNYAKLYAGLRVYIRFTLAAAMVLYGAVKVIKTQFSGPALTRLVETYGESSPMGLLWTFMAASEPYNIFTGSIELLGGILLTTRRTTLLGALVCIGAMSNVFMLNVSYDVSVKLYSLHLLLMAIFLAVPDLKRLADFFILNRPTTPLAIPERRLPVAIVRTIAVIAFCSIWLWQSWDGRHKYGDWSPKPAIYGIYEVDDFEVNGTKVPPLLTEKDRWRRVIFDYSTMNIYPMTEERQRMRVAKIDTKAHTIQVTTLGKKAGQKLTFTYTEPAPGQMVLAGTANGKPVRMTMHRTSEDKYYRLLNRGFHWISDYAYNR